MCGIFAAINDQSVTDSLMDGLQALAYRGYDSAGIAVIGAQGLDRRRAEGKLENLARVLQQQPLHGSIGIAHTRWATHGAPTRVNAHPHMTPRVAVAHNGIIENHQALRDELQRAGRQFHSDTDSEVIPQLINHYLEQGLDTTQAVRSTINRLEGSFAIAAVFSDRPDMVVAARHGSPLVIGKTADGYLLASDANALASKVTEVCYLQDGDLACVTRSQLHILDADGQPAQRCMRPVSLAQGNPGKQGFAHYMLKEIHEQPEVLKRTLEQFSDVQNAPSQVLPVPAALESIQRLAIVACGTSYYAGMIGKYWLEGFAALPTDIDVASEARYRGAPISRDNAALFISQSGETADTLAALRHAKAAGQPCVSLVNVDNSSMALESDGVLRTLAGPEIGVASTKAFTAQLAVLLNLALAAARANQRIDDGELLRIQQQVQRLPEVMRCFIQDQSQGIQRVAEQFKDAGNMLYLGRGIAYPLAMEGALKLKEISYIHAESYPAGELKHGPIALIDDGLPVVVVAPPGHLLNKTLSNLREVATRGAKVLLISNAEGVQLAREHIGEAIVMPDVEELLQPILYALPLQLFAYHIAVARGTDVDQPRNLAKSVTVE